MSESPVPRPRDGHDWEKTGGLSYVCRRCGLVGYVPASDSKADVSTTDDCDHHIVEEVICQ